MEALERSGGMGMGLSQNPAAMLDDGSVAFQDTVTEEPLFQAPQEVPSPPIGGNYSNGQWGATQLNYRARRTRYPQPSPAEANKLINIAIPSTDTTTPSSPAPTRSQRKRKPSLSPTNLNSKVAALRDSVPSLCAIGKIWSGDVILDDRLQEPEAEHKLK